MNRRLAGAVAGVGVVAALVSPLAEPTSGHAGQIVFAPVASIREAQLDPYGVRVTIWECRAESNGLRVTGHVDTDGSPRVILFSRAGDAAGFRVGAAFARDASPTSTYVAGDFAVTLPRVNASVSFAALPEGGDTRSEHGPISKCP